MSEDRKDILLRAAYDILKRCDDGPYVEDALSTCARWDDANCDGMCLMEEIADLLGLDEGEPPIPLEDDNED